MAVFGEDDSGGSFTECDDCLASDRDSYHNATGKPLKELLVLEEEAEREAARALAARQAEENEARKHTEAAAAAALKAAKEKVTAEKDAQRRQAAAEEAKDQADTVSQGGEPGLGPAAFAGESAGEAECGSAADT